jgi:hypothetical protein
MFGMSRRVRVSVVAIGVCIVSAACARPEMGYRNTAPIRTEAPRTSVPTTIAVAIVSEDVTTIAPSAVSTVVLTEAPAAPAADLMSADVAPTSTKPAPGTPGFVPAPVPDDYRIPIIMKVVAKSPLEQEVLDASSDLFVKLRDIQLRIVTDRKVLAMTLRGSLINQYLKSHRSVKTYQSEIGPVDRIVVQSLRKVSKNSAIVRACEVDSAKTFERTSAGTWKDPGNVVLTLIWERQVVRTADGWRVTKETVIGESKGVDRCSNI